MAAEDASISPTPAPILDANPQQQVELTAAKASTDVSIPSSESFTFEDVNAFLCSQQGTIVALLGDRDSGKSTLICSIYDRFLHGPFADCDSCGIRTIVGLERKAHLERTDSGRITPDTQHTSIAEGLQYFHFPVVGAKDSSRRHDLLVSDRAGELYKNARGNSGLVSQLTEIPSADYVAILLDGARLVEPTTRAGAFYAVRQSLQMLLDCGVANRSCRVQVVTTKIDLIQKATDANAIEERFNEFENRTHSDFASRLASLKFYKIAARDPQGTLDPAFGVDALLHTWLEGPKHRNNLVVSPVEISTEFDKLSARPQSVGEQIK